MVLIAAAVTTKTGKTIMSRQFVEMTKARIEGLLAAFPKLMSTGKQHTFVETESVRYVYQPLEKLYMLLITTKASNILEDLETLRLFSRVIPEYCRSMEEAEIIDNAFSLIFAFDEIVALGYRESVNLAQIRTFVEMDSHEEKVYQAVRKTQEREAKNKMREKAKELQRQKLEAVKRGGKQPAFVGGGIGGGFGSSAGYTPMPSMGDSALPPPEMKPSYLVSSGKSAGTRAMKLGSKGRDVETFVDQLKTEGEVVGSAQHKMAAGTASSKAPPSTLAHTHSVHLRQEEKLEVRVGRDGGIQSFELHGILLLRIADEAFGRIRFQFVNKDKRGVQVQTHPNIDKELFKSAMQIGLKNAAKPFPLQTDVGVLKWRLQTQEDTALPLTINCWPSENAEGGCDVNIEYELEHAELCLTDVTISIPLPVGGTPVISDCDGEYRHEPRKNVLVWELAVVDASNKSGGLEFSVASSIPADFFPVQVSFKSATMYSALKMGEVVTVDEGAPVKHSIETVFYSDKYEIV